MKTLTTIAAALALGLLGILPACSENAPDGTATREPTPLASEPASDFEATLAGHREELVAYLVEHPDLLEAAVDAYQGKLLNEAMGQLAAVPGIYSLGPADASVTVVEFFDYHCGYCKRALDSVLALIKENKDVRVVFAEFPILAEESETAAKAALASARQGKYLELHTALMRAEGRLTADRIETIAKDVGLDVAKLKKDQEDPEIEAALNASHRIAGGLGINGTPSFLVNGELVTGWDEEHVKSLIDKAREDAAS